jgi:ABC-2 type transport system permease protein
MGTRTPARADGDDRAGALQRLKLDLTLPSVLGVLLAVGVGGAIFSTFSLIIACLVKTRERFMGIG